MMRRLGLLAAAALLAAGCGGGSRPAGAGSPPQLTGVDQLRTAFNSKSGEPKLIVLVSPT